MSPSASYALTPMQAGMLFHWLDAPGAGVDLEQIVGRIDEALEAAPFRQAWEDVGARYDAFRKTFRWEGLTTPRQVVHRRASLAFREEDWRQLSPPEQDARLDRFLTEDRARGFELDSLPLMRVSVFRTGPAACRLVWSFPHVLMDGRSFPIVLGEVFAAYAARREGRAPQLPAPASFAEHVRWLDQRDRRGEERFWRERLSELEPTPFPPPLPREERDRPERRRVRSFRLDAETTAKLHTLARIHRATLETMVHAAWLLLLQRYTGRARVCFGAIRACRRTSGPGAEQMVGVLINTLPIAGEAPGNSALGPWLTRLREEVRALRPHEHVPLVDVLGWSAATPEAPLFETLVLYDRELLGTTLSGLGPAWAGREFLLHERTPYPLTLYAYGERELLLTLDHDARRLPEAQAERLLGHLQVLLQGFARAPGCPLGEQPLLSPAERERLLRGWNQTAQRVDLEHPLQDAFSQQAAATPARVALRCGDESLSYAELEARANRLAHHLRGMGVGPETLVGLCAERSLDLLVGLLAILKADGAYLPLDPSYPRERLAFIMEDAGAPLLLTQRALLRRFGGGPAAQVLLDDPQVFADQPGTPLPRRVRGKNLAYVIYTSGSTGKPKGVMVEHRNLSNFLAAMDERVPHSEGGTWLALTSLSFDISILELLWTLARGFTVIVHRDPLDGMRPDASPGRSSAEREGVAELIARHGVTHLQCTPSLVRLLLAEPSSRGALASLRALLIGGEAFPEDLAEELSELVTGRLLNMYGPTETTIWSLTHDLRDYTGGPVSLGRPIANTELYLLDERQRLVPQGVPGELCIGGAGVTRGYLNRPALSEARYVPHPFAEDPEERLYRTGDLVRYCEDGSLEFLGRNDQQVKVGGHRIELGEVEAVLARHPGVREAVVLARDAQLVAFYVPATGMADNAELTAHCRRRLPGFMVPANLVPLSFFPRTPNGKLDRRALPQTSPNSSAAYFVAPRNAIERELAEIWREVLGVEFVGVNDSFFELGGNSLSSIRIAYRVRQAFAVEVPLRSVLQASSVAGMAERIQELLLDQTEDAQLAALLDELEALGEDG